MLYVGAAAVLAGVGFVTEVPLLNLLLLPFIVPMLAVSVSRPHDTGRSGRRMFIALIPVAGPVVHLAGMTVDSTPGTNQYGPSPKDAGRPVA